MRINQLSVKDLFGVFNHTIPLNQEDRVTIIIGSNRVGKAVVLRMLDGIVNSQCYKFRNIPFRNFQINLDNNDGTLVLDDTTDSNPKLTANQVNQRQLQLRLHRANQKYSPFIISPRATTEQLRLPMSMLQDEFPGLERISSRTWRYQLTGEILGFDDVVERFGDQLHPSLSQSPAAPEWLTTLRSEIQVRLIETQRLIGLPIPQQDRDRYSYRTARDYSRSTVTPAVSVYTQDLATAIKAKIAESAELSQNLDRTFPRRVVTHDGSTSLASGQLQKELDQLETKRNYLVDTGLLEPGQDIDIGVSGNIDDRMMSVLSVYVKDASQKLSIFDDMAERIDLLKKLINGRFLYKELAVSRDKGFIFINPSGDEVPVTGLSSGEQHRLALLYELLFRVQAGSLILIDEPELSLHVVWQESFLRDIQEIARIRNFDVVIATHSPQIINDRWDLAVELNGPTTS